MATEWFAALRQETERLRAFMPEDLPSGNADPRWSGHTYVK